MALPSNSRLTRAYQDQQTARTLATLQRIVGRAPVTSGRVIPTTDDLPIHDGRRIEATVLFLDICRFSKRPAWTEDEQQTLLRIISLLFAEMIRVIEDYGGVVEKNTGDGLMAYFTRRSGDTETPQQRALAAALTMFSAKDRLINPIIAQSNLQQIDFRLCLDHGPITIANVGAARGFKGIVAIGATANIASKMLAVAGENEILIGSCMLSGLPMPWVESHVKLKTTETGWFWRETGETYCFWTYGGRWTEAA